MTTERGSGDDRVGGPENGDDEQWAPVSQPGAWFLAGSGLRSAGPLLFDRLVRLVTAAAGVPISFSSAMTAEGSVVMACRGLSGVQPGDALPVPPWMSEELATTGVPLIVQDVSIDPRSAGRTEASVASCVGFPVRDDHGKIVAALWCAAPWATEWLPGQLQAVDIAAQLFADLLRIADRA